MGNIIDYVRETEASFSELPLNRVDSLVLSWLAYAHLDDDCPARSQEGIELSELFGQETLLSMVAPMHDSGSSEELMRAVAASPRFGSVVACLHSERWSKKDEVQFSGTVFDIGGGDAYVAFRGTDNTLVGWKEDFNMAFMATVPAQTTALAYLTLASELFKGRLWVGGHSKGGNLAVYAAMMAPKKLRKRIECCFSHDGPGFLAETREDPNWSGAYELVDKTVPEESIIGLLLETDDIEPFIVESTNPGLMQHAPFSWAVEGDDFKSGGAVSYKSYRTNKRLRSWMLAMDTESRGRFVELLYKVAQAPGEVTFSGLIDSVRDGSFSLLLKRLDVMGADDRDFFTGQLDELVATLLLGPAPKKPKDEVEEVEVAGDKIDDITAKFNDRLDRWEKYLSD